MTFQDNLRHYREKAGYSQAKDFAAAIGVKYSTYIGYESQGKEPKYDTLRRIAEALNVSIDTLLSFRPSEYGEYKRIAANAGYTVEEDGNGFITISRDFSEKRTTKNAFSRHMRKALNILDDDLIGIRTTYIIAAMNELLLSPDLE